jgi:peptidase M28-like protein
MIDYRELMTLLSVPRPNGSAAELETECALRDWLTRHSIQHRVQAFLLYPYFFECIGLWLILSRTLLAVAIWARWGWITLPIALLSLLGGTLDVALNVPLVTWPGARHRENIIIEFEPAHPQQEFIFSAHYDSKTEVLDHFQRMFFLKRLKFGIGLTALLGIWGILQQWLVNSSWGDIIFWTGVALTIPMLLLAWGFGLHLSLGRWLEPSQGTVDNGAACAVLLGLAERLAAGKIPLTDEKITLALFTGEEVNMQGSRAYVHGRAWTLPTVAVNMEVMAQDGDFIYWQEEGNAFHLVPTDARINQAIAEAVERVTGRAAQPAGPINSDGGSFLLAGIPAITIGTLDTRFGETGFHRPTDNLHRVVYERLPQTVEVLATFLSHKIF